MDQNHVVEEARLSFKGINREEARNLTYYMENLPIFEKNYIVKITFDKTEDKIIANGFAYCDESNKLFKSNIKYTKLGYEIITLMEDINSHKDRYSIDKVNLNKDGVKIISKIENMEEKIKVINYREDHRNFTK